MGVFETGKWLVARFTCRRGGPVCPPELRGDVSMPVVMVHEANLPPLLAGSGGGLEAVKWFVARGYYPWLAARKNASTSFQNPTEHLGEGLKPSPTFQLFACLRQPNPGFPSGMDPGSRPACPASSGESKKAARGF